MPRRAKTIDLPGTTLMPGVVGHATDIIEHPQLVADRLVTFANIVGRENATEALGKPVDGEMRLSHGGAPSSGPRCHRAPRSRPAATSGRE